MTKTDAIDRLEAAKTATTHTLTTRPAPGEEEGHEAAVSIEAIDGALAWVESTFDTQPPTGIYATVQGEAIDFVYGVEPQWLTLTVHGDEHRECDGIGYPRAYDGDLMHAVNPTIDQIKAFFNV